MKGAGAALIALLLAIAHATLAIVYANETPYRTAGHLRINRGAAVPDIGAPDERQHANYIQDLLDGKGFPVFQPNSPEVGDHYEDHQPPLYYLIATGFANLVAERDVNAPGAIKLRWLNAFVGASTVLGSFYLGLWGIGRSDVAVGAAAIVAFLPMNCALSGAISNDPLLFAVCTWTLAVCAKAVRQGWTMPLALTAGILTGLAILTKTTAVALLPILLLAVLVPQKKRPTFGMVGVAFLSLIVLATPWLYRNQRLYGDPLAQKVFQSAFVGSAQKSTMVDLVRYENPGGNAEVGYWRDWVGWWTARSFFGVFGYMDIWLNETGSPYGSTQERPAPNVVYRLLLAVSVVLLLGWIASFVSAEYKDSRAIQLLNAAFLVFIVGLFILFNRTYFQGQGRYLYPAIGPISIALAIGCSVLFRQRGKIAMAALAGAFLLVNVYAIAKLPSEFAARSNSVARDLGTVPIE